MTRNLALAVHLLITAAIGALAVPAEAKTYKMTTEIAPGDRKSVV